MRELCYKDRKEIENTLEVVIRDLGQVRGLDDSNRVRQLLDTGGALRISADMLDWLMAPGNSTLEWGTAVNLTAGNGSINSVQFFSGPYDTVNVLPGDTVEPGATLPLRRMRDVRFTYERWVEPHFGLVDYVGVTSMARAIQTGGDLSVNDAEVEKWLDAHHRTAFYQNYSQR